MPEHTLTRHELNRALLARQMLLQRETLSSLAAIERLVGMQAQTANAPYIGLWSRLQGFQRDNLSQLLRERQVVRATLMRSTLHLFAADDYIAFRHTLQPALTRALGAFFGQRAKKLDIPGIVAVAHASVAEQPRTFVELRATLSKRFPDTEPELLAYLVRTHLPLVQVPPAGLWGMGGSPAHALAEDWLGSPLEKEDKTNLLIRRYLAAFGPAAAAAAQAWSGLTRLRSAFMALRPELVVYRDERGADLFDLPDAPLPSPEITAPVRFLPEFDNLILSHADRTRVIADEHRSRIFLSVGRVRATFLVDGFVACAWKTERERATARLIMEPFNSLPAEAQEALAEEGAQLLRFIEPDATTYDTQFRA